jgi:hypothetical protein
MKNYTHLLLIICLCLLASQHILAQINSLKTTTGYRILPESILRPNTKITTDNLQTSSSNRTCATPDISEQKYMSLPWYGNETYLDTFYDSLQTAMGYPAARIDAGIEDVWLRIPIQFWVYRVNATTPGITNPQIPQRLPNERDFQILMDELNGAFRRSGINFRFFMQCVRFVDDASAIEVNNFFEEDKLATSNRDNRAINVHIVDNIVGAGGIYNPIYDAVFIERGSYLNIPAANERTFTHEIGHYFSLLHTHFGYNFICIKEPVSRGYAPQAGCLNQVAAIKTCTITGDMLSDTPADPNIDDEFTPLRVNTDANGDGNNVVGDCSYQGTVRDYLNNTYAPDVANYMSYADNVCISRFSDKQKKQINRNATWRENGLFTFFRSTGANSFDRFEPDNNFIAARNINFNEVQRHSFHLAGCGDNEDWLRLTVPANQAGGPYTLEIREVGGSGNVVASVETFVGTLNAQNEITARTAVTATNTFAGTTRRVTVNTCPGTTYMFRVVRNASYGQYDAALVANRPAIAGPDLACGVSSTFSIINPIAGSTYLWSIPSGLQLIGPNNMSSVQVRATGSGVATIRCDITPPGCTQASRLEKIVQVSSALITLTSSPPLGGYCPSSEIQVYATISGEVSSHQWTVQGGLTLTYISNSQATVRLNDGFQSGTVTLTVTNSCGVQQPTSLTFYRDSYCSDFAYVVYPNPADEYVEIGADETAENNLALEEAFEVQVYDLMGVERMAGKTYQQKEKLKLKVKGLPPGSYILHIVNSQGVVQKHLQIH